MRVVRPLRISRVLLPFFIEGEGRVCDNVLSAYRFTGMPQALLARWRASPRQMRGTLHVRTRGTKRSRRNSMKKGIHPEYVDTVVTCTCGNSFHTRSTITSGEMRVDVCSACHPFYTGKQKILDTGGRVAKFEARYGKRVRPSK